MIREDAMETRALREWLAAQGCSIAQAGGPEGSEAFEIRRGERRAVLPVGTGLQLDDRRARWIVEKLGLDWADLPGRWEHFAHGADVGVRGIGRSLDRAFAEAARAMVAAAVDLDAVRPELSVALECSGENVEDLLYAWLNAVVYEMATRRMLFSRFDVTMDERSLRAVAWGERASPERHEPAVEIKGATFTALAVRRDGDDWIAECVVDV